jgi:CDP-glucose 4,6-dehydratase
MFDEVYKNRRVLVTGHTGFKGSWLCEWLQMLGAEVSGFALDPPTLPSLFAQLHLSERMNEVRADIRDATAIENALASVQPDIIMHLAAQPLVRLSYGIPAETFEINVMGTVRLLDAVRKAARPCAVVIVTTDKCYENHEWVHSYREEDAMGGYDPYSASKACAELVVNSYRRSFFTPDSRIAVASVRAGNVIGGGDWALDRIVPDCVRSLSSGKKISVRNPHSTRPWQHVLEPLSGYLLLGKRLLENLKKDRAHPENIQVESAFNFGPNLSSNKTVGTLVEEILRHWPGAWENQWRGDAPHEASLLNLATDKAHHLLSWSPKWAFAQTVEKTISWYKVQFSKSTDMINFTRRQIDDYMSNLSY